MCPSCRGRIKISESLIQCENCHDTYSIINGVPCFVDDALSEHQKSELESVLNRLKKIRSTEHSFNSAGYKWAMEWINDRIVDQNTKIICIGGAYIDDLPHVKSDFKFNIDHLAHQYIKILPEMASANVKHIASVSEALPFRDAYAHIIYSRNSLNHVCNPIKTLIEINRVLKPKGRFFLSVYYNSQFIDSSETTAIDDDFVNNHLKNLFDIQWLEVRPSESESIPQPPEFSLPNRNKLGWLYAICKKKKDYRPYDGEVLEKYGKLTSNFHSAVYYDKKGRYLDASKYFAKVLNSDPFLEMDKMRILYSKIRYLAINDHEAVKNFFDEFKLTNSDPFWWKVVIESSWSFMKDELKKQISLRFSAGERVFLDRCIRNIKIRSFERSIKKHYTLYRIAKPVHNFLKRVSII